MSDAAVTVTGHGVHGGEPSRVTLHRREGPVEFRRNGVCIPAHASYVTGTRGATTLTKDGESVTMVEHLLAAFYVLGIWSDLLIEVEGNEIPILDGSAETWHQALRTLDAFPDAPEAFGGEGELTSEEGGYARLVVGRTQLDIEIDFAHPAIGVQRWSGSPETWTEVLSARTFGFARDVEALRAAGLARGASAENAIVFFDDGVPDMRFPDEPVRHKALDALGDMYLLGRPFAGRLEIVRGGHTLHHQFVTHLLAQAPMGAA